MGNKKQKPIIKDEITAFVEASLDLTVEEQRLILMAVVNAYKSGLEIRSDTPILVKAEDYARRFNMSNKAAYSAIKAATNRLFERDVRYQETLQGKHGEAIAEVMTRWTAWISSADDLQKVAIIFTPCAIPFVKKLEEIIAYHQANAGNSSPLRIPLSFLDNYRTIKDVEGLSSSMVEGLSPTKEELLERIENAGLQIALAWNSDLDTNTALMQVEKALNG